MPVHERRQHFRIEDQIYFDYKILKSGSCYSDKSITNDLLGRAGQRYLETTRYFQSLDYELAELTQTLALTEPAIAHYLNLINAKIDYLVRHVTVNDQATLKKVNISLGGMSFKASEFLQEKTSLKLIIYTKPKMIPIIINAVVIYSQPLSKTLYRTAIQFENLTIEQEQLLSQHIMLAQVQYQSDA